MDKIIWTFDDPTRHPSYVVHGKILMLKATKKNGHNATWLAAKGCNGVGNHFEYSNDVVRPSNIQSPMGPLVIICVLIRVYVPNYVIKFDLAQILFIPWSFKFCEFCLF